MSQDCVVGVYESFADASTAVQLLDEAGFPHSQVSFVTLRVEDQLKRPDTVQRLDQTEKATAVGAASGGLLGLLLGAPLLAIPGIGAAIVAGPIAVVGLTGAVVGGLLGAMKDWSVEEDHLKKYQGYVKEGRLLIVASGQPKEVAEAVEVLKGTDSLELNTHAGMSADADDVVPTVPNHDAGLVIAPDDDGNI